MPLPAVSTRQEAISSDRQRVKATTSNSPLVSVITPVYNGAEFLAECIESVLKQTYSNWVYTIVDNASTDATPEIIAHYAKKDSRIAHARFENFVGAIENHNRALGYVDRRSSWCKVVLADDWLYPECLERMLALAGRSPSIGIVSSFQRWGDVIVLEGLPYDRRDSRRSSGRLPGA